MSSWEERFDDYLEGRLSNEDREAFEAEIERNPDLKEALILHKQSMLAIRQSERELIKNEMNEWDIDRSMRNMKRRWMFYSAAAAVIVMVVLTYFTLNHGNEDEQLYADYHTHYPNITSTRGDADETSGLMELYSKGSYEGYISYFQKLEGEGSSLLSDTLKLYYALACLESQLYDRAENQLAGFSFSENNALEWVRRWYLALAHIRLGNKEAARQELETLAQIKGSSYGAKAKEILKKL